MVTYNNKEYTKLREKINKENLEHYKKKKQLPYQNKNHYHEFRNNFFPYSKLNYISKKSKYIGAITSFYLNLDLQKEHYRRVKILNSFLYSMSNDKKISEQVLEEFKKKNIVLIGYKNFFNEIPNTENIEKFLISKNIEAVYFSKLT